MGEGGSSVDPYLLRVVEAANANLVAGQRLPNGMRLNVVYGAVPLPLPSNKSRTTDRGRLAIHFLDEGLEAGVVEGRLERGIELSPVADPRVTLAQPRAHRFPGGRHREVVQRLVADQVRHPLPVPLEALGVEARHQMVEPVHR